MAQGREAWLQSSQDTIDWFFRTLAVYTIPLLFVSSVVMALQVGGLIDPSGVVGGAVSWSAGFILGVSIEMSMLGAFGLGSDEIENGSTGRGWLLRFMGVAFIVITIVTISFAKNKAPAQWDNDLMIVRISAGILYSVVAHKHHKKGDTAQSPAQSIAPALSAEELRTTIQSLVSSSVQDAMRGATSQLERRIETTVHKSVQEITVTDTAQFTRTPATQVTIEETTPGASDPAQITQGAIAQIEAPRSDEDEAISEKGLRIMGYVSQEIAQGRKPTIEEIMQETGYAKNTVSRYRRLAYQRIERGDLELVSINR